MKRPTGTTMSGNRADAIISGAAPRLPRMYVPRQRLFETLDHATGDTGAAVTLLVAPAGAGKTLGVSGWLRQRDRADDAVWVHADPTWDAARLAEVLGDGSRLVVVDDAHTLPSAALRLVDHRLTDAPETLRLLLLSRWDLPLTRLVPELLGHLTILRGDLLRMDDEESAALVVEHARTDRPRGRRRRSARTRRAGARRSCSRPRRWAPPPTRSRRPTGYRRGTRHRRPRRERGVRGAPAPRAAPAALRRRRGGRLGPDRGPALPRPAAPATSSPSWRPPGCWSAGSPPRSARRRRCGDAVPDPPAARRGRAAPARRRRRRRDAGPATVVARGPARPRARRRRARRSTGSSAVGEQDRGRRPARRPRACGWCWAGRARRSRRSCAATPDAVESHPAAWFAVALERWIVDDVSGAGTGWTGSWSTRSPDRSRPARRSRCARL